MKIYFLFTSLLVALALTPVVTFAQTGKKTAAKEKAPSQSEMDKAMEDAMKGMTEAEKIEMRKMMKDVMPELAKKPAAESLSFTDNKKLIPVKDVARINSIPRKIFTEGEVVANARLLYNKLVAKIPAAEKNIVNSVTAKAKTGAALMEAAITSFLQGHNHAAMALALKAVQASPDNKNFQNNLAAILSQSGYPEKAIPYLKKLSAEFPTNSTILHNLGYAWLSLGEQDTARRLFSYAAIRNPNNPETKLCLGVLEELRGDPKKAADYYKESFEHAPNPFTEHLAKNIKAEDRLEKIDFDKLKKRIVIYEYFKKDWIKIPELSDNVSGYESDRKIKNGYSKMFDELDSKIEALTQASNNEIEVLADKGIEVFASEMMKESVKGLSMMSMPAVYIQKILHGHLKKWMEQHVKEYKSLTDSISEKKQTITRYDKDDKCPDFDRKNNEFMAWANPRLRKFHARKIEEFRVWLNAFCTWSWYITGNPKNTIMTTCIGWTGALSEFYENAVDDQYAIARSCVKQDGDGFTFTPTPAIPNFSCPTVVTIPIGLDELRLAASTVNFDNNDWQIAQAEGARIPNATLSHGLGGDITEAGKYDNPYSKTGNGSITPSGVNSVDDGDLTPLSKIPLDELSPLSKIPEDELSPLSRIPPDDLTPLDPSLLDPKTKAAKETQKIRNTQLARKLMKELTSVKCPGELPKKKRKEKFVVGLGELELFDAPMENYWDEEEECWRDYKGNPLPPMEVTLGKLELFDLETAGPQVTVTNGLDIMGTIKNFIKGLFD
jgi:tetratricopeptide (TPR) repeat protein